ncbi:malonyl-CoA decarboxylase domain-containing protein [Rhizobium laguerreae]|uniref:malonyl-CoA decarboxylase domain-containing protein n=1 Tax=Rhizobium laguerreae TaxID=1076926 RepID=UPI003CCEE277
MSISNEHCFQLPDGLPGISFGNLLIKQVVDDLHRDLPGRGISSLFAGSRLSKAFKGARLCPDTTLLNGVREH